VPSIEQGAQLTSRAHEDGPPYRDRRTPRVTKQRPHQIAEENGFPAPLAKDARGRVWSRYEVQAWAKVWRREKPWR
jgi:hypothetical protein